MLAVAGSSYRSCSLWQAAELQIVFTVELQTVAAELQTVSAVAGSRNSRRYEHWNAIFVFEHTGPLLRGTVE